MSQNDELQFESLSCGSPNMSRLRDAQKGMPGPCSSAFRNINSPEGPHQKIVYSQSRFEGQCRRCIIS